MMAENSSVVADRVRRSFQGDDESTRPIFVSIQTSAYSGATLLAFLLATHPQIATVGEMNGLIDREDPERYLCSCGKRIRDCEFWWMVGNAMRARGFEFDVAHFDTGFDVGGPRLVRSLRIGSSRNSALDSIRDGLFEAWPPERRRVKALVARNEAFVEAVLQVTGKRVFVDTSKDRSRAGALRRFSGLDVRALHLVRDVRGVVASQLRRGHERDAREAARQWLRLHQRLQSNLQRWPRERYIRVRYEDICRDGERVLDRLYRFCGVDPALRDEDREAGSQHIIGNAMRLRGLREVRIDERWRELLTKDQLNEIGGVAGKLSRRYGYAE